MPMCCHHHIAALSLFFKLHYIILNIKLIALKKTLQMVINRFYHVFYRFNQSTLSYTIGVRLGPLKGG